MPVSSRAKPTVWSLPSQTEKNLQNLNTRETYPKLQFSILLPIGTFALGCPRDFESSGLPATNFTFANLCGAFGRRVMKHLYSDHRRILLIDQNSVKQNLRATVLRNYEIEVHTAGSITDAAKFWTTQSYDLVLLAASEDSADAVALSALLGASKNCPRIGLLVGPPAYVRELGGKRKKAETIKETFPVHPGVTPSPTPQWQEMIRKLVSDWYVDQNALLGLSKPTSRIAGA